nr:unnamed protein product [Callosobruchus analis]
MHTKYKISNETGQSVAVAATAGAARGRFAACASAAVPPPPPRWWPRKFQKENNFQGNNDFECVKTVKETDSPETDSSLIKVIGIVNVKRWITLKTILNCKTNWEFAAKLLDIAQEFLNRKTGELAERQGISKEEKKKKHKNATIQDQRWIFQVEHDKNTETNDTKVSITYKINEKQSQKPNDNRSCNLIVSGNDSQAAPENQNYKIGDPIVKNSCSLNIPENEIKIEKREKEETNQDKPSSLDVIKIRLCHYCNTHHIQDHCPINLPQYNIFDNITLDVWNQNYKALYDNFWNNVKRENRRQSDMTESERLKYSFSLVSLPDCLQLADTNPEHGIGVFAKTEIECFTQMGPLVGKRVKEMEIPEDINMKYLWEINVASGHIYFSTEDNETSNWLKFIRPAPSRAIKNLTVIVKDEKLYFVSIKVINPGDELLYWQDTQYQIHCSVFHDIRYSLTIKKYHCKVCGEAVLGKENIMKHAAELHNGQGAYQCQFCKKFFLRLNYLEMHRTYGCSANPHRSRPLCDFCGKKFCQPQKLKIHIKRMHSDISEVLKEFQCKSCMKILGSRAALQRHDKEVHQKQTDGQWSCGRCGKKFQNKSNLKIHMLTHSGIKPFKCSAKECKSAFTTKQCLQFHYKKVHNYTDETMPKIERSVDYTFQAYSGAGGGGDADASPRNDADGGVGGAEEEEREDHQDERSPSPVAPPCAPPPLLPDKVLGMKVLSKGSKKWIADQEPLPVAGGPEMLHHKLTDIYPTTAADRLTAKESIITLPLQETGDSGGVVGGGGGGSDTLYDRSNGGGGGKLSSLGGGEFGGRHDAASAAASNASLLVEAALDSVCQEPSTVQGPAADAAPAMDVVGVGPACGATDTLVGHLSYHLTDVPYGSDASRDMGSLMTVGASAASPSAPPLNEHISVTDDLNDKLHRHTDATVGIHYSEFQHSDFSPPTAQGAGAPPHSPDMCRSNFVRNYINSLSPQNMYVDHFSSDDSNGMAVQNLSLHPTKTEMQLDLSIYKSYKASQDYMKKLTFEHKMNVLEQEQIEVDQPMITSDSEKKSENLEHSKYSEELSAEIRNKFDIDLDMRLKSYEAMERNHMYESSEMDFRSKSYDICDMMESRNKQYELESVDFCRSERAFEPLMLNTSELQGLDMSARSGFHSYAAAANIGRYHHLPPPPPPPAPPPPPTAYSHADLLRAVSLDLSAAAPGGSSAVGVGGAGSGVGGGRHSVDLSLRTAAAAAAAAAHAAAAHPLHQIAAAAAAARHHLALSDAAAAASVRLLTDHTASRILNDTPSVNHMLNAVDETGGSGSDVGRTGLLSSEQSRLLDQQSRLISDVAAAAAAAARTILPGAASNGVNVGGGATSPPLFGGGFGGAAVTQQPYHPTPLAPPPPPPPPPPPTHVTTSPPPAPYHYPAYY